MISEPLDLHKILLKFHSGQYGSLLQFTQDMKAMFDNYKKYFSDPEEPVNFFFTDLYLSQTYRTRLNVLYFKFNEINGSTKVDLFVKNKKYQYFCFRTLCTVLHSSVCCVSDSTNINHKH